MAWLIGPRHFLAPVFAFEVELGGVAWSTAQICAVSGILGLTS